MSRTPELDRQRALNQPRPPFDVLSDFYNWLEAEGLFIAHYGATKQRSTACTNCKGRRFDPDGLTAREGQLLARGALPDRDRPPCPKCDGTGVQWHSYVDEDSIAPHPLAGSPARLFAEFWGLDLNKIDRERETILAELRETAPRRCRGCMNPHTNTGHYCDTCSVAEEATA